MSTEGNWNGEMQKERILCAECIGFWKMCHGPIQDGQKTWWDIVGEEEVDTITGQSSQGLTVQVTNPATQTEWNDVDDELRRGIMTRSTMMKMLEDKYRAELDDKQEGVIELQAEERIDQLEAAVNLLHSENAAIHATPGRSERESPPHRD